MKTPLLLLGFLLVPALRAADAIPPPAPLSADDVQFFESKIRPILADNCYKCHSRQADKVNKDAGVFLYAAARQRQGKGGKR
mgnify:CR=1 FL=1